MPLADVRGVRRRSLVLAAVTVAAVTTFCLFSWGSYVELRRQRLAETASDARKALLSFENQSLRLFDYADSYLRSVRSFYGTHPLPALHEYLDGIRAPHADSFSGMLAISDADGRVIFHSDAAVPPGTSVADRDFFQHFRSHPQDEPYLSETGFGRVAAEWRFRLVRPILRDGKFAGLMILTMRPEHLARFYRDLALGRHSSAAMQTLDGRIIAREPAPPPDGYGRPVAVPEPWNLPGAQSEGTFHRVSAVDGIERTYLYGLLPDYPAVLVVGYSEADIDAALSGARTNIALQAAAFSVAAIGFCLLLIDMDRKACTLVAAQAESADSARLLADANARLERSNADLEHFAYVASHDLQAPLRTISSYAQLLERRTRGRLDSEAGEYIGFITAAAKRMGLLITDLLQYARVGSDARPLRPVSVAEAVHAALDNLATAVAEAGVLVSVGTLPVVMAERSQLISLFQNLIGNAIKYRHPDRNLQIAVTAERGGEGCWRIAVADNGVGIPPEQHEKIFVIFERGENGNATEGAGVGLALCRRIARNFGGDVHVDSAQGAGSTFIVSLVGADVAAPA